MIHLRQNRMDRACVRVMGTVHQAAGAGLNCRSRAHGARFNCSKQFAVDEPVVTDVSSRFAQRHDFSVSGWIAVGEVAIPSSSNRSEEHTSELQSHLNLVCRLLLEKKKK